MRAFCNACGAAVGVVQKGGRVTRVNLAPIAYWKGAGRELITAAGERIEGTPCRPEHSEGIAYAPHWCGEGGQHG